MKNYTSTVPANRSISNIEHYLARNGVLNISKTYNNGEISAIYFQKETMGKAVPFKLPANVESCYRVLRSLRKRPPTKAQDKALREQAGRTAWKIISDWVEIQMTLIEMEQAEFMEIFLPYVSIGEGTYYEKIKAGDFKLLESK